ncbi:MAG: hypothetical protein FD149_2536 [Rhodospirillaceae bacterium]|nr:MAG: hypothetical protein FD149_2536 [Rhodospirillaceae bacterium]
MVQFRVVMADMQTCGLSLADAMSRLVWTEECSASVLHDTAVTSRFCRECQDAMALGDLEEMIRNVTGWQCQYGCQPELREQWTSWSGGPLHGDAHQSPSAARAVIDGQPAIDEAADRLRRTQ